jgi:hypothetical protein
MAIQLVNLGTYANDSTGDDLRTAFNKVNANFTELDTIVAVNAANLGTGTGVFASKVDDPGLGNLFNFRSIAVGSNLTLSLANNTITVNTQSTISANLIGNVTGNSAGTHTGPVIGNVTGNVTGNADTVTNGVYSVGTQTIGGSKTFSNPIIGNLTGNAGTVTNGVYTTSSINALADVDTVTIAPTNGQALAWSGTAWTPQTIAAGVSRIIAGTNVTISPTNGLGQVTINSSGVSDVFDLGEFQQTYENPISYLLDQVGVDVGTFTSPASFTIDGGTF